MGKMTKVSDEETPEDQNLYNFYLNVLKMFPATKELDPLYDQLLESKDMETSWEIRDQIKEKMLESFYDHYNKKLEQISYEYKKN